MDDPTWISIVSIAISSVIAFAVVWLGAKLAHKQAHLSRVWERKADAYSEILEALHEIEHWFRVALDDEYLKRDVDDEVQTLRDSEYLVAITRLRRRIAREVWLLPNETQILIATMNDEMSKRQESWFEHLDNGSFEVRKAVGVLTQLAKSDLRDPIS